MVEPLLIDAGYVERLKGLGGQRGLKFKEYRSVRVRLGTGQWITVKTAYFLKAQPKSRKRRAKRQRRGGRGAYWGLEALGFIGHYSLNLVSEVAAPRGPGGVFGVRGVRVHRPLQPEPGQ